MSSPSDSPTKMTYRFFLGNFGLLVSKLSLAVQGGNYCGRVV
ncbi:hypothetical protein PC116_g6859 [Phytophthora cactorum]|uniref:Uncharacterized protein n=1 Tax=Phytophthora cactorum TaxID=29920 RepID=A0A8T1E993_9STRA|nr:hypothetical protein Pcac1_g10057 [Phytophthora cactorum]KAG2922836.1 hypothetical protein PC114_g5034 [Phytophthora cactorum]KAG2949796.1 hypothetical protein PC117_g4952 [Phytophthora cactorum]KAG3011804.1 hypothetical protein PC119_g13086 [Phytophthora cactorum]KAG3019845.1 hypothetical protein PC120_g9635 [Phytophthora cactorum]